MKGLTSARTLYRDINDANQPLCSSRVLDNDMAYKLWYYNQFTCDFEEGCWTTFLALLAAGRCIARSAKMLSNDHIAKELSASKLCLLIQSAAVLYTTSDTWLRGICMKGQGESKFKMYSRIKTQVIVPNTNVSYQLIIK